MRKRQTAIPLSFIFILLLQLTIATPAYAAAHSVEANSSDTLKNRNADSGFADTKSAAPDIRSISSLADLLEWHNAPSGWNEWPVLSAEVVVNRPIILTETAGQKDLGSIEHIIRVAAGGSLTLDNSKLSIQGPGTVIVVESGGQLLLKNGAIYTAPNANSIVVEKGGKLIQSAAFHIDGKVLDKNDLPVEPEPSPNPLPPAPEEKPEPPVLPAIKKIFGVDASLTCLVGEPPALSEYPATRWITYEMVSGVPTQKELPIKWELDTVDFETAGTHQVKGIFTADVLAANGISNPNGISATLQLTVLKPSPIDTLTGNVLSVGSAGNCLIRLAMPPLPEGATALYLYRSADGKHWQKAVQEIYINGNSPSSYDNFLPYSMTTPTTLYVTYRYQTDYCPIWLRVEVAGSAAAGISNEIRLEMPVSAKPGGNIHTGETGDDGGSGGNRGGGGQSEGDRVLPNVQEKPEQEVTHLPTDQTPSVGNDIPPILPEQAPPVPSAGGTWSGQTGGGETPNSTTTPTAPKGITESKPPVPAPDHIGQKEPEAVSTDTGQEEPKAASPSSAQPPAEQEAIPAAAAGDSREAAAQVLSNQTQNSPPMQRSRGVLLTAGATVFAAAGLLLIKRISKNRKRKP